METQCPSPKRGRYPKFSAHVYCGQTAGWIRMPLGTKVGLSPGDSVLDVDSAPSSSQTGWSPLPIFSAHFYCGKTTVCIKMPLVMEVGLRPGDFVSDGDPAPLPKKEAEPGAELPQFSVHPQKRGQSPNFRPIFIVAKRLDASRFHLAWR